MATLHRDEHGGNCHQSLSGADIALQQTMHRCGRREIAFDLGNHPPLGTGEFVRKSGMKTTNQLAVHLVLDSDGLAFESSFAHDEHQLDAQELVEGQSAARGFFVGERVRGVDSDEGLMPFHQ